MPKTKSLPALTPRRYLPGLFSLDVSSLSIKDTQQQLEHPLFSLSKKPDLRTKIHKAASGAEIEINPGNRGMPTIWDKDLLIYAVSFIRNNIERGEEVSPRIRFHTADVIEFCQRIKGGSAYARLDRALMRLAGALIRTNVRTGGIETTKGFHIIEEYDIKRQYDKPDGRLIYCEFTLSDWLFRAVKSDQEILTLHPDYFRLRRALDRRLYEIARKHCGRQADWAIGIEKLHSKCGSGSELYEFRRCLRRIVEEGGDLLEYDLGLRAGQRGQELVVFRRREGSYLKQRPAVHPNTEITLSNGVAAVARKHHGSWVDLNAAERDWKAWMTKKAIRPVNTEAMFLSFLVRWVPKQGHRNAVTKDPAESGESGSDPVQDWIHHLASVWWDSLEETEKTHWRETIGQRVELNDGQGWFRTDESIATRAFDLFICPRQTPPRLLPASTIAAVATQAGVTLPESDYDAFSVFVTDSVTRKSWLENAWRGALPEIIKAFMQQQSVHGETQEVNHTPDAPSSPASEPEVARWIQDAERYWKALPETTRAALTTMIRTGPGPEMADGQGNWIPAPQGWTETLLAQAGYAAVVLDKPPPRSLPLRLPPGR